MIDLCEGREELLDEFEQSLSEQKKIDMLIKHMEVNKYFDNIPVNANEYLVQKAECLGKVEAFLLGSEYGVTIDSNDFYVTFDGYGKPQWWETLGMWFECNKDEFNIVLLLEECNMEDEFELWLANNHPEVFIEEEDED